MAKLLKNPFFLGYLAAFAALVVLLRVVEGFSPFLPLFMLVVVGILFSCLAWWLTTGFESSPMVVERPFAEAVLLVTYVGAVAAYLTWGVGVIESLVESEASLSIAKLVAKLALFVGLPFVLFRRLWGYRAQDFFRLPANRARALRIVAGMSIVLVVFQIVVGQGMTSIRASEFHGWRLAIGLGLAYAWLVIEVGLVEEFFFRGLVQSRLTALLRSEVSAIVVMSVLFGLAHAPGLYLRPGVTMEAVGSSPSLLLAVGYSIVIVSTTGFFLGTLWARTRSLIVLALIHAAGDLVPNAAELWEVWGWG